MRKCSPCPCLARLGAPPHDLDIAPHVFSASWPLPRPRSSTASTHAPSSIVEARERAPRVPALHRPCALFRDCTCFPRTDQCVYCARPGRKTILHSRSGQRSRCGYAPRRPHYRCACASCITGGVGCQRVRVPHYCLLKAFSQQPVPSSCPRLLRTPSASRTLPPSFLKLQDLRPRRRCGERPRVILLPPPRLPSRQGEDLGASAGGRTPPVRKLSAPMADRAECQELAPPRPSCNAPDLGCDTRRVRRVNTH
ncbi:hypothetical protein B0H14DRAFT_3671812, partial [Mycena olivaceomarginata]